MKKFVFVVGGVMSSVGKGVATSSIALILKSKGFKVTAVKADPYINVDAGTMNPVEHGEVFVLNDADETDQDLGNYERFLDQNFSKLNYMTTGRVYQSVINRERNLEYAGKCVEVVPHIPQEIINRIEKCSDETKSDITIIEIGGTVGEYQNILFLEAIRILKMKRPKDVAIVLVSYLPIPSNVGEMKTKPTQHAARTLNSAGLQADFIVCRSAREIDRPRREKLATFCMIEPQNAISSPDLDTIYEVPFMFEKQNFGNKILKSLSVRAKKSDLTQWKKVLSQKDSAAKTIKVAIVGKYFAAGAFTLSDSYISVIESVKIAAWHNKANVEFFWINSEDFEKDHTSIKKLSNYDGVIVPGGFGSRGIEGIIATAKYCRENKLPYFGLCYGMQILTIEYARSVLKFKGANTEEINPKTTYPVIHLMADQKDNLSSGAMGGTMRLGKYNCTIKKNTLAYQAYRQTEIEERHRHRYEFNNKYRSRFEKAGLVISGINKERDLVEIVELKDHPFYLGVQFHPEFKTRFIKPHPLFNKFVETIVKNNNY